MIDQNILQPLNTFFLIMSFVLGSMIGSFLNVCIWRLPRGESVVRPRSRCPKCGTTIAWYDNIPLISWLALGAKCRHCSTTISWQYPFVEALTAALFCCAYWRFGMTLASPIYMVLLASLVLVTFVDLADWTIPNEVTFPGIPIGIGCAVVGMFYPASGLVVHNVFDAFIGAVLGGLILFTLDKITLLLAKKRGMGFGDVKLLTMLGAFLGWKSIPFIIMGASLVGSAIGLALLFIGKRRQAPEEAGTGHYLPFGPYLALGGVIYLFFGQWIIEAYLSFLHVPEDTSGLPM